MNKGCLPSIEAWFYSRIPNIDSRRQRRKRVLVLATYLFFGVVVLAPASDAFSATFNQTNWGAGVPANSTECSAAGGTWAGSECTASDPSDQTGWNAYSSKDANMSVVNGGADLKLGASAAAITHNKQADFALNANVSRTQAGAADFATGTPVNTVASVAITLSVASTSPVWSANTGWNSPDAGSASVPAFSDMDADGDLDLMAGNSWGLVYGYKNTGTTSSPVWTRNAAWDTPDVGLYGSPAIADLDNDGDLDMLIGQSGGVSYGYENTGSNTSPSWMANSAWDTPDVGTYSRPRLADLDGDGDFDLLQGSFAGTVYAYENTGTVSAPTWTAKTAWNAPDVGSYTVPALGDLDNDGDFDLMIGDYNGITYGYENTGSSSAPAWTAKTAWNTVDVGTLAAPGLVDLDSDGDLEILIGENVGVSKAYENTGSQYVASGDFVSSVIDTGTHSGLSTIEFSATLPANTALTMDVRSGNSATPDGSWTAWETGLASGGDISGQGGNRYVQYRANLSSSDIAFTPSLASVTIIFVNFPFASSALVDAGGIQLKLISATPAWTYTSGWNAPDFGANAHPRLVDMDDDGDHDLMVGDNFGVVFGVENTGSDIAPSWVAQPAWNTPDLGSGAAPGFADLDNDGDFDMLVGDSTGNINAYENTGDKTAPTWAAKPAWNMGDQGSSGVVPALQDLDGDGDFDVLLGTFSGISYGFENTGSVTSPIWTIQSSWNTPDIGSFSSPALADLDGDGDYDLLIGSGAGSTYGYENTGGPASPAWTARSAWNIADIGSTSAPTLAPFESDWDLDVIVGDSTGLNRGYKNTGTLVFEAAGQYLSSIVDVGFHAGFTTLEYASNAPIGTAITVDLRSGATALPDGSWSAWQAGISNGGNISSLPNNRYVQYRINLSATDTSVTPSLSSITINYSQYVTTASLISSAYDSRQAGTIINSLAWGETLQANTDIRIQMRRAADNAGAPGAWSAWVGPGGTAASFWNSANAYAGGCSGSGAVSCGTIPPQLRNALGSQWFQYKVTLVSSGVNTPVLADIGVEYVTVNSGGSGGVTVSAVSGSTSEAGGTTTFTVVLDNAPVADVVMGVYSGDLSEGTVNPATLTFTSANWNTAQTVTVTGVDDVVDDGDVAYSVIVGAVSSTDANYDDINPADVLVSNVDNDDAGVTVMPTSGLITNETGQTASFSMLLTSQPSADVSIALSSSDTSEGTVLPASLIFTPANWAVAQSATVTGVNDGIIDFGVSYSIITAAAVSADSSYAGFNPADVSVVNEDDDTPDIVVSAPYGLVTSESGGFAPISITLTSAPSSDVTFSFSTSDSSEGYISPFMMTFTPANWNTPSTATIVGVDDGQIDGDQTFTIVTSNFISSDVNFNTANPSDITVINVDNDDYSVSVTPTSGLVTTEYGGTASFVVRLGSQPTSDVVINLVSSDSGEGVPVQNSITFASSGTAWRGETVTVVGIDDRVMDDDQLYTIVLDLVSSDPNFSGINPADVTLTNSDNNRNTGQRIANNIAFSRFGTSVATADVNCDAIPDLIVGTVGQTYDEVYVYHGSATGYNSSPNWIGRDTASFTNFGRRVFGVGDLNKDGCGDIMVTADDLNSRGKIYLFHGSASGLADADDDGIGRPSDAVWEVLGSQNSGYLGESITAGDFNGDSYLDIAVSARGYSNGSSNEGRVYVFLNAASGLPDANSDGIGLTSEATWMFESDTTSGSTGLNQGLAAANVNGDVYADLMIGVQTYANGQNSEGRIFAFYGSASGFNDAGADGLAHPADADWAAENDDAGAYMSSVANAGDLNGDGVDDIIIGAFRYDVGQTDEGAAYVFYGANPGGLPDADSDGIARPSDAAWQVESNDAYAYLGNWVSPAGDFNNDGYLDVLVGAYGYSPSGIAVGGAFVYPGSASGLSTTAIWTSLGASTNDYFGRVVGLIGDIDNDGYSDIYVSADAYGDGSPDAVDEGAVFVYVSNIQTPGVSVSPSGGLTTTESAGQALFSVVLDAPPLADVTIALSSSNTAEGGVSPASLTFTQTNWMTPQTVTVTGVNDAISDGDAGYSIVLAAAVSADGGYSGLNPADVAITNLDNDVPQQVGVAAIGGSESASGSVTFTRSGEITAAMTVSYSIAGTAVAGTDYQALSGVATIPLGSASVVVPVAFIGDMTSESNETIIVSVDPSAGYVIGSPASATLTITDDDIAGAVIWPSLGLVTTEAGGMDSFVIRLSTQPSADVTINLSSSDAGEALVLPPSVTFTPSNWNVDQVVTVVGQDDGIVDGDVSLTIITSAAVSSDSNYNGLAIADVSAANRDDDSRPTISLSAAIATVNEGDNVSGVFTISRTGATTDDLRVFYSVSGTANRSVDYGALAGNETILAGNSSVSISLNTIQDALVEGDETVVLTLAPGSDYIVGQPDSNSVTIVDDDDPAALPLANFALDQTVGEGRSVTVTAILNKAAQTYPVTIPCTVSGTATNPADHDAANGNIVIASGTNGSMTFNVVDDGTGETDETVMITMGTPVNAKAGSRRQHVITITESNEPPKVILTPQQGGADMRLVVTSSGNVTVTAVVTDPNPGDSHSFDWSMTNNNLVDINDANPATFVFDPSALMAGFYKVRLTVTDSGTPAASASVELLLEAAISAPFLTGSDSDNDGIADNAESFDDSDGDGIADYLDSATLNANELQLTLTDSNSYIMRTEAGLNLGLGDVAFAAGADGAYVTTDDIAAYGGGEGDAGVASAQDTVASPSDYVDFTVSGLPEAGQSVKIVIPQFAAIPVSPAYRKYDPQTGWRDFVIDVDNSLASAPGAPGLCPLPGDSAYIAGLHAGDYCIQLMIKDGGPNDTDGEVNNIVEDPGSIIEEKNGGGGQDLLVLLALLMLFLFRAGGIRRHC